MAAPEGKITKQFLKTCSGEFDVESIHTLNLQSMNISDLGCIGECLMLERLDLSQNNLSKLYLLAGLTSVYSLNLAANRISSLEGLQSLDNLQSLNVSGNLIGGVDTVRCLALSEKLTDLRLQDTALGLTNPICMNNSYKADVLKVLPNLRSLDGERVTGKGSDLYEMCTSLDRLIADSPKDVELILPEPTPWKLPESLKHNDSFENTPSDAQQQLEELLMECKNLAKEADDKIQIELAKVAEYKQERRK